jgi:hypothetical protein
VGGFSVARKSNGQSLFLATENPPTEIQPAEIQPTEIPGLTLGRLIAG